MLLVEHARLVPGQRLAGRPGRIASPSRADEDVHHLGRADAVDDPDPGRMNHASEIAFDSGSPADTQRSRLDRS
jgi:hypothetical protein